MTTLCVQDCDRCGQQPELTCDIQSSGYGRHEWNLGHHCPDGLAACGLRGYYQDDVIREWNRQQIAARNER